MKKLFNAVVFAIVAYLVADRAMLHAQARDLDASACVRGAEQVRLDALDQGFSHAAANSQGAAFRSQCLVTGGARAAVWQAAR
ncbi:adhesin [Caballeronia sp. LZ019]|uniref:adhesin n=1 Tax=Caballeronia sp. LZ019 TaxID=3038555 RepID=UPI00285E1BB3|nr:adhesin [Caballeronia sp. LZ019]MDR5808765.1 adhesin [Caballeronia sp. LZ019]